MYDLSSSHLLSLSDRLLCECPSCLCFWCDSTMRTRRRRPCPSGMWCTILVVNRHRCVAMVVLATHPTPTPTHTHTFYAVTLPLPLPVPLRPPPSLPPLFPLMFGVCALAFVCFQTPVPSRGAGQLQSSCLHRWPQGGHEAGCKGHGQGPVHLHAGGRHRRGWPGGRGDGGRSCRTPGLRIVVCCSCCRCCQCWP